MADEERPDLAAMAHELCDLLGDLRLDFDQDAPRSQAFIARLVDLGRPLSEKDRNDLIVLTAYDVKWRQDRLKRRAHAHRVAVGLLRRFLDDRQRQDQRRYGWFHVVLGDRIYRIWTDDGWVQRVERYSRRERYGFGRGYYWSTEEALCHHDPEGELPGPDVALANMLYLLADEEGFLAAANHHPIGGRIAA